MKKKWIIIIGIVLVLVIIILAIFIFNNKKIMVKFVDDDEVINVLKVDKGDVIIFPVLEKEGYVFDGWYYKGKKLENGAWFMENAIINARWTLAITISFDTSGGNIIEAQTIGCSEAIDLPVPKRDGYKFVNWIDQNEVIITNETRLACEDITLKAIWKKIESQDNYSVLDFEEVLAQKGITSAGNYNPDNDAITIYLFYGDSCIHCYNFLKFMADITGEYGNYFKMQAYEVWSNQDNAQLLDKVSNELGLKSKGVPYIVIGEKVFMGYSNNDNEDIKKAIMDLYKVSRDERYDVLKGQKQD